MVAMSAAKELMEKQISIPSSLITQDFLLENNVTNLEELDEALPAMTLPGFVSPCWIKLLGGGESSDNDIVPVPTPVTERPSSSGKMLSWLTVPAAGLVLTVSFLLTCGSSSCLL